jgi:hypothetical protein
LFLVRIPADVLGSLIPLVTLVLALAGAACAANDGMRFEVISLEREPEGSGLPPPADYTPCYSGEARAYDTNGDGKPDRIKVSIKGKERCYGEDSNHDGVIDTWDLMDESGNLARRAHDSNGDGKVDQAWTFDPTQKGCGSLSVDRDGDGKNDLGIPLDICKPAAPPAPPTSPSLPTPAPTARP